LAIKGVAKNQKSEVASRDARNRWDVLDNSFPVYVLQFCQ
jgi:hypothetical protein